MKLKNGPANRGDSGPDLRFGKSAVGKRSLILLQTALPLKHTGAAYGKQAQRIFGSPLAEVEQLRPHADGKLHHGDAVRLRQEKMSQLMGDDDHAEYNDEQNYSCQ